VQGVVLEFVDEAVPVRGSQLRRWRACFPGATSAVPPAFPAA
jgi:hypothetical protein